MTVRAIIRRLVIRWTTRALIVGATIVVVVVEVADDSARHWFGTHSAVTGLITNGLLLAAAYLLFDAAAERRRLREWETVAEFVLQRIGHVAHEAIRPVAFELRRIVTDYEVAIDYPFYMDDAVTMRVVVEALLEREPGILSGADPDASRPHCETLESIAERAGPIDVLIRDWASLASTSPAVGGMLGELTAIYDGLLQLQRASAGYTTNLVHGLCIMHAAHNRLQHLLHREWYRLRRRSSALLFQGPAYLGVHEQTGLVVVYKEIPSYATLPRWLRRL